LGLFLVLFSCRFCSPTQAFPTVALRLVLSFLPILVHAPQFKDRFFGRSPPPSLPPWENSPPPVPFFFISVFGPPSPVKPFCVRFLANIGNQVPIYRSRTVLVRVTFFLTMKSFFFFFVSILSFHIGVRGCPVQSPVEAPPMWTGENFPTVILHFPLVLFFCRTV